MAIRCHLPLCDSRAYSYLVCIYIYELCTAKVLYYGQSDMPSLFMYKPGDSTKTRGFHDIVHRIVTNFILSIVSVNTEQSFLRINHRLLA